MGIKIDISYDGQLRCTATHQPSGATVATDAPTDNHGRGESFSPTDLVATALGACMLTIMGIVAKRESISLEGTRVSVTKEMVNTPFRRIGSLAVDFHFDTEISPENRLRLENAAMTCPVHRSMHPDVKMPIRFFWKGASEPTVRD